mmetsp:Transcript_94952/g.307122  ORF Transcript_94952/g.307122 Transcript_94952/m.307122 type:complete len:637 (-) Transcript_94952:82-1992(-)
MARFRLVSLLVAACGSALPLLGRCHASSVPTAAAAPLASDAADDSATCLLQRAPAERRLHAELPASAAQIAEAQSSSKQQQEEEALFDVGEDSKAGDSRCRVLGGRVWLSQKGADYLVERFTPEVVKLIENLELAAIEGSMMRFKYKVNDIRIAKLVVEKPVVHFEKGKGLHVHVPNISVNVSMHYRVDGEDWFNPLYSGGRVHAVVAKDTTGTGLIEVGVSPAGNPHLNATMHKLSIGLKSLELSGTVFAGLTNFVTKLFKEKIEDMLSDEILTLVEWFFNEKLNSYMDVLDLLIPLPLPDGFNVSSVDLRLCGVHTSTAAMVVDISGAIIDPSKPHLVYPEDPMPLPRGPPMPLEDFENTMVAMMLTKWTINSGLWLYNEEHLLKSTIAQQDLPASSLIVLNADSLRPLIQNNPDVPRWWWTATTDGQKSQFSLDVACTAMPEIDFKDGKIGVTAPASVGFKLDGVSTANLYTTQVQMPVSFEMSMSINSGTVPQQLNVNLEYASALPITIVGVNLLRSDTEPSAKSSTPALGASSSWWGWPTPAPANGAQYRVNLWAMSAWIEMLSRLALVPMANDAMGAIEFPSAMGIDLVNSSLEVTDHIFFSTGFVANASRVMEIAYYGEPEDPHDWGEK